VAGRGCRAGATLFARAGGGRCGDDCQAPALEVVRDLVDLRPAFGVHARGAAGVDDRRIERVLDSRAGGVRSIKT
jgi:hypothetical protein